MHIKERSLLLLLLLLFCYKGRGMFYEWTTEVTAIKRLLGITAPLKSATVTDVAFHSTHRKGYLRKLSVFYLKGSRSNFWGLFQCDNRRSLWWASCYGPQNDCGRSDIVVINMNFNSYASLATLFNTKLYILHKYWFCLTFITVGKRAI